MGSVDRKLGLLGNIARLRRAQLRAPGDRDLAAVRAELERELGEAVSRRVAAAFLGVSHAALARWIDSGDVPTVFTVSGREDVPVPALLDLHERVERERRAGPPRRHVLEAVLSGDRARAERMRVDDVLGAESSAGHAGADRRGLAYHRALAPRLDRRMVDEARHRIWKWREAGRLDPRHAEPWEEVLELPLDQVRQAMTEESPRGRDLRQNSPFAGMLSEPERRKLVAAIG